MGAHVHLHPCPERCGGLVVPRVDNATPDMFAWSRVSFCKAVAMASGMERGLLPQEGTYVSVQFPLQVPIVSLRRS